MIDSQPCCNISPNLSFFWSFLWIMKRSKQVYLPGVGFMTLSFALSKRLLINIHNFPVSSALRSMFLCPKKSKNVKNLIKYDILVYINTLNILPVKFFSFVIMTILFIIAPTLWLNLKTWAAIDPFIHFFSGCTWTSVNFGMFYIQLVKLN